MENSVQNDIYNFFIDHTFLLFEHLQKVIKKKEFQLQRILRQKSSCIIFNKMQFEAKKITKKLTLHFTYKFEILIM